MTGRSTPPRVDDWVEWFAVLGDRSRLTLLLLIVRGGPISVSELAAASGLKSTTVSHSLRLLRVHEMVQTERDGNTVRYRAAPHPAIDVLDRVVDPADPDHEGAR